MAPEVRASLPEPPARIAIWLQGHGAGETFYGSVPLLDHLRSVYRLLVSWGAPAAVCRAGLCHAVYPALLEPTPEGRRVFSRIVGRRADEAVAALTETSLEQFEALLLATAGGPPGLAVRDALTVRVAVDTVNLGWLPLSTRSFERQRLLAELAIPWLPPRAAADLGRLFRLDGLCGKARLASWRRFVSEGYREQGDAFNRARQRSTEDLGVLALLDRVLAPGARVLDAGCGAGDPVGRRLAGRYLWTGIDRVGAQLVRARQVLGARPSAAADLLALPFAENSFDAVVCYYTFEHLPRPLHSLASAELVRVLRPGGWGLFCLGADDRPADLLPDFFGAPMWFSHYDAEENRAMLTEAGLAVAWSYVVGEGTARRLMVLARLPEEGQP